MRPADCGGLCFDRRKVNLSQASAGQQVGVRQVTDRIWFVSFMDCDLGYFDDGVGSSGWIRTSNPPVNRLVQVGYRVDSSWV